MKILDKIALVIRLSKEKRIKWLSLQLIKEMEPFYSESSGLNYIDINYDYSHIKNRYVSIESNHGKFKMQFETNELNANFKPNE